MSSRDSYDIVDSLIILIDNYFKFYDTQNDLNLNSIIKEKEDRMSIFSQSEYSQIGMTFLACNIAVMHQTQMYDLIFVYFIDALCSSSQKIISIFLMKLNMLLNIESHRSIYG